MGVRRDPCTHLFGEDEVEAATRRLGRTMAWRVLGWVLAVGLLVGWLILFHSPGTVPWLFIATAGVAAVILVTSIWSAWPHGGADS